MKLEISEDKLLHHLVQVIDSDEGVVLRRGSFQTEIKGNKSSEILRAILALTTEDGSSLEEIIAFFPEPMAEAIETLVDALLAKRILYIKGSEEEKPEENNSDVLYWEFGTTKEIVADKLNETSIAVLGVNQIAKRIVESLRLSGAENIEWVDFPELRNINYFNADGSLKDDLNLTGIETLVSFEDWRETVETHEIKPDCIVATSDFGGWSSLAEWNEYCVEEGITFMPVLLHNLKGYAGPIVVPGETACFNCYTSRMYSNTENFERQKELNAVTFAGQKVNGFHHSMTSSLGDVAALELYKFYTKSFVKWRVGESIEMNILNTEMKARKVLKLPRCKVCSTMLKHSERSTQKIEFIPQRDYVR